MFKAIIFDMDGTLVDSEVVWDVAEREMFADMGLVYNAEVREQVIGLRLDEFFEKLIGIYGLDNSVEELQAELIQRMLLKIPEMLSQNLAHKPSSNGHPNKVFPTVLPLAHQ